MNISCIYNVYLYMVWEMAISFTLMGGGHPFIFDIHIDNAIDCITKYTGHMHLKVKELPTLLLKVEGVSIMPFQLRRMNGPPPMERRTCMSFKFKSKVEIYSFTLLHIT